LRTPDTDSAEILVIEDDPDLRESLIDALRDHGFSAVGAQGGRAAVDYLRAADRFPRLILLDLHMRDGDGDLFRQQQLDRPDWAAIPVVVVTGDGSIRERAGELGVAGYLRKPVDAQTLVEMVLGALVPSARP
jgi:DNA-binding response OmpR family regulator